MPQSLLIAPFLSGQYFCDEAVDDLAVSSDEDAALFCAAKGKNGVARITAVLDALGPRVSPSSKYQLGYTLIVPLFRYYKKVGAHWTFDVDTLKQNLSTISDVDRPVVVYLSCNHFIDAGKALCKELQEDPVNLMWNRNGPMLPGAYFHASLVPWTLEDQTAPVNILRRQAFAAATSAIRALPTASQEKIAAVSVLGEVHQMYTNFFGGPGFVVPPFESTDYAPIAIRGFRTWLAQTYGSIATLNNELNADFTSFEAIYPPSKDINTEKLNSFFEHIDVYAAGNIPVYGWLHDTAGREIAISVYLDGQLRGRAQTGLSRTDVTDAVPAIRNPNVGFRMDLDFRKIEHGIHTLEVLVSPEGAAPLRLARQELVLVNRAQEQPSRIECIDANIPPMSSDSCLSGALDGPKPWAPAFYNPLACLWLTYRNLVVRNYIEGFAQIAIAGGIPKAKLFSHQVTPGLVGSWNGDLLAADASKLPSEFYNPGTTLYGGAAFGSAFLTMKKALGWDRYSVGEMHPMAALTSEEYLQMFEMHRTHGAVFVAPYFMYIGPERLRSPDNEHERFRIARDNRRLASDAYWQAIQDVMTE